MIRNGCHNPCKPALCCPPLCLAGLFSMRLLLEDVLYLGALIKYTTLIGHIMEKAQKKCAVPLATQEELFILYYPGFLSPTIYRDGIMLSSNGGTAKPTLQRSLSLINNRIGTLYCRSKAGTTFLLTT